MPKPRIFIHMHYLELGGAEMALIGLLDAIDKSRYDVDLFLNQHTGAFMPLIPHGVNLLPEIKAYSALERSLSYAIRNAMPGVALRKILRKRKFNRYLAKKPGYGAVASHFYMDYEIATLPSLNCLGEYDLAISFLDPPHVVQDKVLAKKRIEWIHTDFAAIKYDTLLTGARWGANDHIISISEDITRSFSSIFPELADKLVMIENIISPSFVARRSKEFSVDKPQGRFLICSIGRLNAEPKNFKVIPEVASILKKRGINILWRIIGPGDDTELRELVSRFDVADMIELTGAKTNPYPYIAACDLYAQPSLYEGKSIAVREAQILHKPVLITDYPSSKSQVKDGVDGVICKMPPASIADAIERIYASPELRRNLSDYLSSHDYGMMSEVEKLYKIIDNV